MMASSEAVTTLNERVANAMRVFDLNAREAMYQVIHSSVDGLRMQDRTEDGSIELYALTAPHTVPPFCVNAWFVSPHGDAADVTDADVFLRGDQAVGFDSQPLDWGWQEEDAGEIGELL